MPRAPAYQLPQVLEQATRLFWAGGYSATGMDDVVQSTGLNRHSLYRQFSGKAGLFLACLAHYRHTVTEPYIALLVPEQGLAALRAYFRQLLAGIGGGRGCLFANASAEAGVLDEHCRAALEDYYRVLGDCFRLCLAQAATAGEIRTDLPIPETAAWLVALARGLALGDRAGEPHEQAASAIQGALALLQPFPPQEKTP